MREVCSQSCASLARSASCLVRLTLVTAVVFALAAPSGAATGDPALINEVLASHSGTDDTEFVELYGIPGTSLSGLSLIVVEGDAFDPGRIDRRFDFKSFHQIGPNGFFLFGNCTGLPDEYGVNPDAALFSNYFENSSLTVALVETASVGDVGDVVTGGEVVRDTVALWDGDPGDQFYFDAPVIGPDGAFFPAGARRLVDGVDTDTAADWTLASFFLPGDNTPTGGGLDGCAPLELEIWEIQGSGLSSPYEGEAVIASDNLVTEVAPRGFFMQTPAARSDNDPDTSDGIFVFTGSPPAVAAGDSVEVAGDVQEFFELTEISDVTAVTVLSSGNPLPAPMLFDETTPSPFPMTVPDLERFEGMLASFEGIATGPTNRFGEVAVVAGEERAFREPGILYPGLPGLPVFDGNPQVFEVDTDALDGNADQVFAGQEIAASGPVTFAFGDYQILPSTLTLGLEPPVLRPVRERAFGELTVASQNALRLFDDQDDPTINEPVLTPQEFADLLAKFSLHVREVLGAPDILAFQEIENLNVLESLAAWIEFDDPSLVYSAYLLEGNDVGGIDVGYLTRDDTIQVGAVTQFGKDQLFYFDDPPTLLNDRPPLVLEADYVGGGGSFPLTVINAHQRSLGGIDDPDDGTRVKTKRLEQAESLAMFVQDLQSAEPERRVVVTGDFNAFQFTDGYVDVMGILTGTPDPLGAEFPGSVVVDPPLANRVLELPAEERYSLVFEGDAEVLDHALTTVNLASFYRGFEYARGNADAPGALREDPFTPLASSDHDGLVLYLIADSDGDGVPDDADVCPGTVIPESVPTRELGVNRWALVDGDGVFDTQLPMGEGPGESFTIEATAGCSCEQIIDALDLGEGHRKFGCSVGAMRNWVDLVNP